MLLLPFLFSMNRAFLRFIFGTVGSYVLWFILYEFVLKPNGRLDHILTENISIVTCYLLNIGGYDSYYTIGKKLGETYIFLNNDILPTVRIGAACNGLEMLVIFSFFVAWYPGNTFIKACFIGGGLILIHALNILRNFVLTILAIDRSIYFELFHRYIFIFLIYGSIFILWMIWANFLSKYSTNHEGR